jgi:hypothetical protein
MLKVFRIFERYNIRKLNHLRNNCHAFLFANSIDNYTISSLSKEYIPEYFVFQKGYEVVGI